MLLARNVHNGFCTAMTRANSDSVAKFVDENFSVAEFAGAQNFLRDFENFFNGNFANDSFDFDFLRIRAREKILCARLEVRNRELEKPSCRARRLSSKRLSAPQVLTGESRCRFL